MIIPEIQRCEEFTFYGGWSGFAVPAHYFGGSFAFPHLHTLITNASFTILLEEYGLARTFSWFSHALKNAPKLVTVESLNVVPSELFPCHQLTTVRSGRLEVTEMARILLSCSNLKKLVVDTLSDDGPPPDVIVHSSLRELTIRTPPDWLVEIVNSLAQFSLPALQMFELDISGDSDEVQVPTGLTSAVVAAIQCFSASLRKLVLMVGARDIDRTLCRDVLQICPDLYCFGFKVYAVHPEDDSGTENRILHLIQDLTITDTSQAFLAPKLVELCLLEFDSRMTAEYATTFLDMVESRSAAVGVTRLMDAELQYFHDWELQPGPNHIDTCISDSSIVERIEVLSRKGIHCAIVSIDD
ncbi:hypothetical protein VNI00_018583 [Paramarasmius palmivorus]|uniref:FBD domain-containing protein n=1 Tax=Paramarasmius palmivorus TaxID=297713 RepID=A0AAW0AZ62_9AGAR